MTRTSSHIAGSPSRKSVWMQEIPLLIGIATFTLLFAHWSPPGVATGATNLLWTCWILISILACAFRAMRHADMLAVRFGEPIGTIILTVAAIIIEVAAVSAVMLHAKPGNPAARDTMFAVLMLIFNLLIGLSIVLGCMRKKEQEFNLQSSGNYLSFIIALATISLILPRFTSSADGGWMSSSMEIFVGGSCLLIYILFLLLQTSRAKSFFAHVTTETESTQPHSNHVCAHSTTVTIVLLFISLLTVVLLSEYVGARISILFDYLHLPTPLVGIFIAAMVLAPEGLAALRAAYSNDMQRAINVLLGGALGTIGLTLPAIMILRYFTDISPELGLEPPYIVLFVATLGVSIVNLTRGKVNMMQGLVHILLFFAWIAVIFDEASISPNVVP